LVVVRESDGLWKQMKIFSDMNDHSIVTDEHTDEAFLICSRQFWNGMTVQRIGKNELEPVHLTIPGVEKEYLAHWKWIGASIICGWLLHLIILLIGTRWAIRQVGTSTYEFGNQVAELAPFSRRCAATIIDACVALFLFLCLGACCFDGRNPLSVKLPPITEDQVARELFEFEQILVETILRTPTPLPRIGYGVVNGLAKNLRDQWSQIPDLVVTLLIAFLILLGVMKVWIEGRDDLTPGKWIMGLRTKRDTLRNCGIASALVRNLLYFVDVIFFVSPLPAVISIILSDKNQTIGDRIARTVVIRANSIRTDEGSSKGNER